MLRLFFVVGVRSRAEIDGGETLRNRFPEIQ
jgi:hypothetical protein